jgi:hypothetical protein
MHPGPSARNASAQDTAFIDDLRLELTARLRRVTGRRLGEGRPDRARNLRAAIGYTAR